MKLQQLRYMIAVSENGSFSQAARVLGVAQPALSQQIQAIEAELSVELFHRATRGVMPTTAGLALIEHAYSILDKVELARRELSGLTQVVSGDVEIVLTHAIADRIVPKLVEVLYTRHPDVTLKIRQAASRTALSALANGDFDMGIVPSDDSIQNVNARTFVIQNYCLVQAGAGALQRSVDTFEQISLREAAKYALVLLRRGDPFRERLEQEARRQSIHYTVKYETSSLLTMHGIVEAGLAGAIIPWTSVRDKVMLGRMTAKEICDPQISLEYLVAWPKQRPLSRAATCVADILSEISEVF
ncbi:LysR family transcriptional regulator [Marinovum algicola]|nr:LysR family transcriptional regulator [Marinovum algicola]